MARKVALWLALALACSFAGFAGAEEASGHELAGEAPAQEKGSLEEAKSTLWNNMNDQLHHGHFQWLTAAVALILGTVLWFDGTVSFKLCSSGIGGVIVYVFALSQIHLSLEAHLHKVLSVVLAAEFAVMAAIVLWLGFAAVKYGLGAVLGYMLAKWITEKVSLWHEDWAANKWFLVANWNLCILLGLWLLHGHKLTRWVLNIIAAFFGAMLISSCMGYFLMLFGSFCTGVFSKMGILIDSNQNPRGGYWIEYLLCIINADEKDVGIFQDNNSTKFDLFGQTWHMDCILGRVAWLVIFILGLVVSMLLEKRRAKKEVETNERAKTEKEQMKKAKELAKLSKKCDAVSDVGGDKNAPLLS